MTPDDRHFGRQEAILANLYDDARERKSERWANQTRNWAPVGDVHLNPELKPQSKDAAA